jgi:biotin carboxyl carrier protein
MASIKSPIPGKIVEVKIKVGQFVKPTDEIFVIEAMKMENPIFCDGGIVTAIKVRVGDTVHTNDVLAQVD